MPSTLCQLKSRALPESPPRNQSTARTLIQLRLRGSQSTMPVSTRTRNSRFAAPVTDFRRARFSPVPAIQRCQSSTSRKNVCAAKLPAPSTAPVPGCRNRLPSRPNATSAGSAASARSVMADGVLPPFAIVARASSESAEIRCETGALMAGNCRKSAQCASCFSYVSSTPVTDRSRMIAPATTPATRCSQNRTVRSITRKQG